MSNTMSEREIEDVLNSVRRLVAQGERRNAPLPPLILTPEMRVDAQPISAATDKPKPPDAAAPGPTAPRAQTSPGSAPAESSASVSAPSEPASPASTLPDTRAPDPAAPALLDDQAVQAMVAQIVRDELHGKLGERITLAVRKLVRNEIARALDDERRK